MTDWIVHTGDCRAILPTLEPGMAVVTDQPYGTGWVRGGGDVGEFHAKHEQPDWDIWDMSWVRLLNNPIAITVMGPMSRADEMRLSVPDPNALAWWRKTNPRPNGPIREPICIWPANLPDVEFAAYNGDCPGQLGRRFVGIEIDHGYADIARRRIASALNPQTYRDDRAKDSPLFTGTTP